METIRYIPTLVGRFLYLLDDLAGTAVHPHACGEIEYPFLHCRSGLGTSPRLWGDSRKVPYRGACGRYIPTLVGRFPQGFYNLPRKTVHPHACGEIANGRSIQQHNIGTSPRLWGDCRTLAAEVRGKTVHPHACGEIPIFPYFRPNSAGTSPRLWGDSINTWKIRGYCRYIPTLVGRLVSI